MQDYHEHFKEYAQQIMDQQSAELKKKYSRHYSETQQSRLEEFNRHLDILRNSLHKKVEEILNTF